MIIQERPSLPHAEGYYDCSLDVEQVLGWQQDGQQYPLAKFATQYHRPDLVRQALSGLAH